MNIIKRISTIGIAVVMMTSIFSMTTSASDYDNEITLERTATEGDVLIQKGSESDCNRIYMREYWSFYDKTNIVDGYLNGCQYDKYFSLKSAYRINGRTYNSTSGKNNSDEREMVIKQEDHWLKYEKKVKSKKMDWVNMRGYTYVSKKVKCTNEAHLKITIGG